MKKIKKLPSIRQIIINEMPYVLLHELIKRKILTEYMNRVLNWNEGGFIFARLIVKAYQNKTKMPSLFIWTGSAFSWGDPDSFWHSRWLNLHQSLNKKQ